MLTRCPQCRTTFRVSSDTLSAAHGQVRCGRCRHRFDAVTNLIGQHTYTRTFENASADEADIDIAAGASPAAVEPHSLTDHDLARIFVDEEEWKAVSGRAVSDDSDIIPDTTDEILVEEPRELEEITLEGRRIEISGRYMQLDDEDEDTVLDGASLQFVDGESDDPELVPPVPANEIELPEDFARPEGFELRIDGSTEALRFEAISTPLVDAMPDLIEHELPGMSNPLPSAAITPGVTVRSASASPAQESPGGLDEDPLEELEGLEATSRQTTSRMLFYTAASLVLGLALFVQILHHHRQDLVRHPRLGPMIGAAYATLGMPLAPNWDPTGFEVEQWGIAALPGDASTLRLRASVTNRAGFAQPYPLLRLSLEDLWGTVVAVRALEPDEYLPPGTAPERMMAPGQRTNAEVRIVDPGEDAVGFRVDACVPSAGGLLCAEEMRTRS